MTKNRPNMNDLRAELDKLEDARLNYVMARARVNSDAQGYKNAGIPITSFYTWPAEERERLNNLAQRVKREAAMRALMVLQDAAEEAARVKAAGLRSRDERIKQSASSDILDRTIGKPTAPVEISGQGGDPLQVVVEYANQTNPTELSPGPTGDTE